MFSPSKLIQRVGVGGGLLPFFKCVGVYFLLGGGEGCAGAAAAKCAPVLCLLLAVLLLPRETADKERQRYARWIALGLALSAVGDALLVWPQLFVAGMAAFGAAHIAYSVAFVPRTPRRYTAALLYGAAALYVSRLAPPAALKALVPLYAALLATMAWRALAALPPAPLAPLTPPAPPAPLTPPAPPASPRALAAPAGAILFLLSDAILGYSLFGGPVPYSQVLVMSTYYLAQLCIALSALLPPPSPTDSTGQ